MRNLSLGSAPRSVWRVILTDALWVLLELTLEGRDPCWIGHHFPESASEEQCSVSGWVKL